MDLGGIIWLFILFIGLQPLVRQRLLDWQRRQQLARIQKARGSRVILLVHRQEVMRLFGVPLMRYIDLNDSEEVLRAIQLTDDATPIDLIVHTPGGLVLAALQIARALKDHPARVTLFVPHLAMSGGTLIALAGDEIVMCRHALLGPCDPQINGLPAASLLRVLRSKPVAEIDDQTLALADVGEKAIAQLRLAVEELLAGTVAEAARERLADDLTRGRWTHDFGITSTQAQQFGLPVREDMPPTILELMALYPQPVRGVPSVEYLPAPPPARPHRH